MAGQTAASALTLLHGELSKVIATGAALAAQAPPPWAALLVGVGVLFLLHGARKRLALALPGGAALGLVVARTAAAALDGAGATAQPELLWISAGAGALLCAGWPPIFPVLALALPGAVAGGAVTIAGRAWLGAVAGAAAGGVLGAVLREWVACVAAGGLGAAAVVAGALGLLGKRPIAAELVERPMVLLAAWAVLTVAGAAFHAGRAWPKEGARRGGGAVAIEMPDETARDSREADR